AAAVGVTPPRRTGPFKGDTTPGRVRGTTAFIQPQVISHPALQQSSENPAVGATAIGLPGRGDSLRSSGPARTCPGRRLARPAGRSNFLTPLGGGAHPLALCPAARANCPSPCCPRTVAPFVTPAGAGD